MAYPYQSYQYPYYPQYSQPNINQPQTNQQGASSLIWVQGEAGAKSYMVAPNTTIALWDSESQTVYLKSADASGMPSMRVLDYQIREDAHRNHEMGSKIDFATKDEVSAIQRQIDEIRANMSRREEKEDEPTVRSVKRKSAE